MVCYSAPIDETAPDCLHGLRLLDLDFFIGFWLTVNRGLGTMRRQSVVSL